MNKTWIIALVAIVAIGGGYTYYQSQQKAAEEMAMKAEAEVAAAAKAAEEEAAKVAAEAEAAAKAAEEEAAMAAEKAAEEPPAEPGNPTDS